MKYYLFGNWKCNPTGMQEAKKLISDTAKGAKRTEKVEVAVFPPFCYLSEVVGRKKDIAVGAQNCCFKEAGAFTGEVSPKQIADLECKYVLVGHSERRKIFSETDEFVNDKTKLVLACGLVPVVCVGETDEERTAGRAIEIVKSQLEAGLKEVDLKAVLVAYEPVWAIGTGKACGLAEAREISRVIREALGPDTPVLYGGSANAKNGAVYLKEAGYNGLLVGGASLKADEFTKMFDEIEGLD
jgi:triosephosphate isomerase